MKQVLPWLLLPIIFVLPYRNLSTYPTDAQLLAWYVDNGTTTQVFKWMRRGWLSCTGPTEDFESKFCKTYGSAGDNELAGIGVCPIYLFGPNCLVAVHILTTFSI